MSTKRRSTSSSSCAMRSCCSTWISLRNLKRSDEEFIGRIVQSWQGTEELARSYLSSGVNFASKAPPIKG